MENEVLNTLPETPEIESVVAEERMGLGILGALVGAVLGGASIILLSQLGYVASISGLILAVCTLKGYTVMANRLSTKGVIICAVLMILTPFLADWIDWAILAYQSFAEYGVNFLDCMKIVPMMLIEGDIPMGEYLKNLGMIYLFVAMGGFYTLKNAFRKK